MILHLFFIFNFGINALPIILNISNSNFDLKQKAINLENHRNKSSIILNISSIISNIQLRKDFNLKKIANDLKEFGINDLKNDKHFEGLPLDRYGKINPDFHKEIFLGNHELFESDIQHDEQKRNRKLEEIFNEIDQDHNERLSKEELLNFVFKNVQSHLKEAKDKNSQLFLLLDTNRDGKITWQEYGGLYIKFHHMNSSNIKNFDDMNFIQESFDENLVQELLKIRDRWTGADGDDDSQLNLDEFLEFRHPEIAGHSYKYIVDDLISQMDLDEDEKLKETEFVVVHPNPLENGDNKNKDWIEMVKQWSEEQKIEFHEMDENEDGFLTRDELLKAYDPMNRIHMNIQIKRLFSKVDDSPKDELLSLAEIKKHADVFTDMRLLDAVKVLHEDI